MKNLLPLLLLSMMDGPCAIPRNDPMQECPTIISDKTMRIITTIIALLLAVSNINAQENMKENVDFNVWPKGELNTAYAKYFIGNSYLAPLDAENGGPVNVTFEPRCRNNWHIHHKSVQVLVCVAGHGWYVEEGKKPVALHPGVVVAIPAEAKHWHGAAKDSWMQHITYMTKVEEGASNEWLEPVTDAEYDKLPASNTLLSVTDAEYMQRFDDFAFDEVVEQVKTHLDDHTRYICYLATLLGCQGIDEYRELLPEALVKGVTPIEVKEIVYQATAYLGMGRVRPWHRPPFGFAADHYDGDPSRGWHSGASRLLRRRDA